VTETVGLLCPYQWCQLKWVRPAMKYAASLAKRLDSSKPHQTTNRRDHDALFFDHRAGRCARGVRFGLGVTGDILDLATEK